MNMDTEILAQLGLSPGEIKVYLALLKLGPSSSGPISKTAQVTQAKVYPILERLEKKGISSHIERNGVKYFQAVEPAKLMDYLNERKSELVKLEERLSSFLPTLEAYHKSKTNVQTAQIYQGINGMKTAHEHIYLKLKKGDEYLALGVPQYPSWEISEGQFTRYWEKDHHKRAMLDISCRLLFNTDAEAGLLKKRNAISLCQARYMPITINTPAYFTIYKDTVLVTVVSSNPICIEITSQEVADAFKIYFERFWKLSKRV